MTLYYIMRIETERLVIRSLKLEDEQAFIAMTSDGSLTEIFGDCSDCDKWMGNWIKEAIQLDAENNPNKAYLAYVIEDKIRNQVIGSIGTSYYEDLNRIGVTYFLGTHFRGKGYMAEAVQAYVQYFFNHYEADTIFALVRVENKPSCATLEKAGFTLLETKFYKDLYDETEELRNFYEIKK